MLGRHLIARAGIAAALLVAAVPGAALAESFDLGTIPPGEQGSHVFGHGKGSFSDTLTFAVGYPGSGQADYYNFFVEYKGTVLSNITNASLVLTGPAGFTTYVTNLTDGASYPLQLLAGSYSAQITGTATGTGGGAYNVAITAPTPEPATMTLMFGGAAAASYMGRRRKRAAARQAAA